MLKTRGFLKRAVVFLIALFLLSAVLPSGTQAAVKPARKTVRILMIGNSLTSSNGGILKSCLEGLAEEAGYQVQVGYVAFEGEKLKNYADGRNYRGQVVRQVIRAKRWDYIIIQEHTKYAVSRPHSMYDSVRTLKKYISRYCPKAKILLNCTWAYAKSMYLRGKWYSHSKQQRLMNLHYKQIAGKIGAEVIWSGKAFKQYKKTYDHLYLYQWDKNHATAAGYYLDACCIFKKVFGTSPYKVRFYSGLGRSAALQLQKCAAWTNR